MGRRGRSRVALVLAGAPRANTDLLYATGFSAPDDVVYVEFGRRRWLVVSSMELGRARKTTRGIRVVTPELLGISRKERRQLSGWIRAVLRKAGCRHVRVPQAFPVGLARRLEARGIRVDVQEGPVFARRAVKSPAEVRKIAAVQAVAVAAMRAAVRRIAASRPDRRGRLRWGGRLLTAESVRRDIHRVLMEGDCAASDTIVAGGADAADPHCGGRGPLRAGQAIVIDIFPRHVAHGYWGDITRTVIRGIPSDMLKRMYAAVRAAQEAALHAIRPGVRFQAVHRRAAAVLAEHGFRTERGGKRPCGFIHGTGHGVGLDIHEAPSLVDGGTGRLRRGHVVTVEPGLYYPGVGGIRIEDTVVVTRRGCRTLARCGLRFSVGRRRR